MNRDVCFKTVAIKGLVVFPSPTTRQETCLIILAIVDNMLEKWELCGASSTDQLYDLGLFKHCRKGAHSHKQKRLDSKTFFSNFLSLFPKVSFFIEFSKHVITHYFGKVYDQEESFHSYVRMSSYRCICIIMVV